MGPPGAGATTLARLIAGRWGLPHLDTDDYYWIQTADLPFRRKRNSAHRWQLLEADLLACPGGWALSGFPGGWGDALREALTSVYYLWAPPEVRLKRIEVRETARYGAARIQPGGDLHGVYLKFLDWAATYDEDIPNRRSRAADRAWLDSLACPVYELNAALSLSELADTCPA